MDAPPTSRQALAPSHAYNRERGEQNVGRGRGRGRPLEIGEAVPQEAILTNVPMQAGEEFRAQFEALGARPKARAQARVDDQWASERVASRFATVITI